MIDLSDLRFPITVRQDHATGLFTITYGEETKEGLDHLNAACAIGGAILASLDHEDLIRLPGRVPPMRQTAKPGMMAFILAPWHAYQRQLDIRILWPQCKQATDDLDHAIGAFMMHTIHDPAWRNLSDEEVNRIVAELK